MRIESPPLFMHGLQVKSLVVEPRLPDLEFPTYQGTGEDRFKFGVVVRAVRKLEPDTPVFFVETADMPALGNLMIPAHSIDEQLFENESGSAFEALRCQVGTQRCCARWMNAVDTALVEGCSDATRRDLSVGTKALGLTTEEWFVPPWKSQGGFSHFLSAVANMGAAFLRRFMLMMLSASRRFSA